jgi:4-hydroxy-tetrahydrodipicolinate reductase
LADEDKRFEIAAAIEMAGHPSIGQDAGAVVMGKEIGVALTNDAASGFDVLIDFSYPDGTIQRLSNAVSAGAAIVVGTTGHSDEQLEKLGKAGESIAVLRAANMSTGVNLLFRLVGEIAQALGDDYDIEIAETHHRFKKDSPSGTAIGLLDSILESTGRTRKDVVHGREGVTLDRPARQIGMHALRLGDTVGRHEVHFGALGETVTISHEAHTRDTFASGALRAAAWVAGRPAGLYTMQDVLLGSDS